MGSCVSSPSRKMDRADEARQGEESWAWAELTDRSACAKLLSLHPMQPEGPVWPACATACTGLLLLIRSLGSSMLQRSQSLYRSACNWHDQPYPGVNGCPLPFLFTPPPPPSLSFPWSRSCPFVSSSDLVYFPESTSRLQVPKECKQSKIPEHLKTEQRAVISFGVGCKSCLSVQARMGVAVKVLDPTPGCPAAVVAEQVVGSFRDPQAVRSPLPHTPLCHLHKLIMILIIFIPRNDNAEQSRVGACIDMMALHASVRGPRP